MPTVHIVTDSTAYLTKQQCEEHNIAVVPLRIIFPDGDFDETKISNTEVLERAQKNHPSTSQPPVGQFLEVFEDKLKHNGEIIFIGLSGGLSGTLNGATQAANLTSGGDRIAVFDSGTTTAGQRALVLTAARLAAAGKTRDEIIAALEKQRATMRTTFVPRTLEYLRRGGRIGGAQALVGTLLQIRPILNVTDGKVEVLEKVRTFTKAVQRVLQELPANLSDYDVYVLHWFNEQDAVAIKKQIQEQHPEAKHVVVEELGPVVGVHVGPGLVGVIFVQRI